MTAMNQSVYDSMDYLPFGEQEAGGAGTSHKFTGYERDTETGNDYAIFRHYGSIHASFLQPDPYNFGANPSNPQSWNGYAYALNNPLVFIDPSGLDCLYFGDINVDPTDIEIDRDTTPSDCVAQGGDWVNGTVNQISYDSGSDVYSIWSSDSGYNYFTTAYAPGPEPGGTSCYGDCDISYDQSAIIPSSWGAFASSFIGNFFSPSFYKQEMAPGGCLNAALEGADQVDVLGKIAPPNVPLAEQTIKAGAATGAAIYAIHQGLTVPLRSSIVRGILEGGETGAAYFTPIYLDAQAAYGVTTEAFAAYNGTCH